MGELEETVTDTLEYIKIVFKVDSMNGTNIFIKQLLIAAQPGFTVYGGI